jgi:hypothetical protein
MKQVYTVISTSGWQGDGWSYCGEFYTRKAAMEQAKSIQKQDAKLNGYITGVIGGTRVCPDHEFCCIGDTSRLSVPAHLRSRKAHINTSTMY